jgi:hypothetical protein
MQLLACLVSVLSVLLAGQAATTAPAAEKTISSPAMHVKFAAPASWTPEEIPMPKIGKTPAQTTLAFTEIAASETVLALVREDEKVSDAEAAKRIDAAVKEMRETLKVGDFKTLADDEIKVAGQSGRTIEGEGKIGEQAFYNRVVVFALDGHLYRLNVNGKKEDCEKLKPAIGRMLATLEPMK